MAATTAPPPPAPAATAAKTIPAVEIKRLLLREELFGQHANESKRHLSLHRRHPFTNAFNGALGVRQATALR